MAGVATAAIAVGSGAAGAADLDQCLEGAALRFGHSSALLKAIVSVESDGNCQAVGSTNRNGTYDIGCMQINSAWLPRLAKQFGLTEHDLFDPCTNVNVGAWILAKNFRAHGDTWRAVGAYNAATETKRIAYAWKVRSKLGR